MSLLLLFGGSGGGEPTSGPATNPGYRGLLALYDDTAAPAPRPAVGSFGGIGKRRRITRDELERRLREQRDNTFGRRWFEEFQAAERAAKQAGLDAPKKAQRKALERAAEAARSVASEVEATEAYPDLRPLTEALEAASGARKLKDTLEASKQAVEYAEIIMATLKRLEDEADEDEAVTLLLM